MGGYGSKWLAIQEYFLPETQNARYNGHPRVRVTAIINNLVRGLDARLEVHFTTYFFGVRTKYSMRSGC
jgi:hypothetical protein